MDLPVPHKRVSELHAVDALQWPTAFALDVCGTLYHHELTLEEPLQREIARGMMGRVNATAERLNCPPGATMSNRTRAEMGEMNLGCRGIEGLENGSVIYLPKDKRYVHERMLDESFSSDVVEEEGDFFRICLGGQLEDTFAGAQRVLEGDCRSAISSVIGRPDWHVVAAFQANDRNHPEITLQDVMASFGLPDKWQAQRSSTRFGNTGIFLKSLAGDLIPYEDALAKVWKDDELRKKIDQKAHAEGILFTPSSKAISVSSAKGMSCELDGEPVELSPTKGAAVVLQRELARRTFGSIVPIVLGVDSVNDATAVAGLGEDDVVLHMKGRVEEKYEPELEEAAQQSGCWTHQVRLSAPLGLPALQAAADLGERRGERESTKQLLRNCEIWNNEVVKSE